MLLLELQVGLGDDPEQAPVGVDHWRRHPVAGPGLIPAEAPAT
jgi:hypothetical protein